MAGEIEYRVTNITGIVTNIADCVVNGNGTVTVRAKGDGEFFLRALCKNGTDRVHILSVLPFTAAGLGAAFIDPYEFVPGGLYSRASENICSGVNRGVGFAFGGTSWAAFDNVDFGDVGTDTVTVSIWANTLDPVRLWVWDGIPGEGELIGDFVYHKTPEWMVFKPETYQLSRKLRGVHTITMETDCGYQMSGFVFARRQREFAEINAAGAGQIYGDKFTKGEDEVTGIGNNVVLDFGEFDFTEEQPRSLVICGKSPLPLNSIHLTAGADRVLCEFRTDGESGYIEREFPLDGISGKQKISFTFLPGSDFDFKYFRFIK